MKTLEQEKEELISLVEEFFDKDYLDSIKVSNEIIDNQTDTEMEITVCVKGAFYAS